MTNTTETPRGEEMTTYEKSMNLTLDEQGGLVHPHGPLEIPPTPQGVRDDIWQHLHTAFQRNYGVWSYSLSTREDRITVFQMTEAERLQWCAETAEVWSKPDPDEWRYGTDRDRAWQRDYLAGGNGAGFDPMAYDSGGNDTGLRESDFI